jgi:hypothetical protein
MLAHQMDKSPMLAGRLELSRPCCQAGSRDVAALPEHCAVLPAAGVLTRISVPPSALAHMEGFALRVAAVA